MSGRGYDRLPAIPPPVELCVNAKTFMDTILTQHSEPNNRAYYDDFSNDYERERARGYHAMLDELETSVVSPLAQGRSLLEAGCGTGLILNRLRPIAARACGVDLSAGMLQRAQQRGLSVAQASITALPFADESFDVVCSFKVLAHIPDIETAVAELFRVVRPGGHAVLEFYNALSLRYLVKRAFGPQAISDGRTEADVYTRWDTPRSIRRYLPTDAEVVGLHGIRVLTPAAIVHRIPVVDRLLPVMERLAMGSPLRYWGGFLVAVIRKKGRR